MPADITGTDILEEDQTTGKRAFRFVKGPVFCNIVLADEINRTPPKTQAALLQAMQEYQVTAGGRTYPLEPPFFVLATQNPVEQEGTYPLPEAQLDRFMFMVNIGYPSRNEERQIVRRDDDGARSRSASRCCRAADILHVQKVLRKLPVSDHVVDYAVSLARATRPKEPQHAGVHQRLAHLGRRPAGGAVPGAGRQGQRHSEWPAERQLRRRAQSRQAGACGIASSPTSTPMPKAWAPTRWSTSCWRRFRRAVGRSTSDRTVSCSLVVAFPSPSESLKARASRVAGKSPIGRSLSRPIGFLPARACPTSASNCIGQGIPGAAPVFPPLDDRAVAQRSAVFAECACLLRDGSSPRLGGGCRLCLPCPIKTAVSARLSRFSGGAAREKASASVLP